MKKLLLAALSSIAIFFFSCSERNTIGTEVQPPDDKPQVSYTDTFSVLSYNVRENPVTAIGNSSNLLGIINDPIFGISVAGFCTQFNLPTTKVNYGFAPQLDSIILSIAYNGFYGDTSSLQMLRVYELDESLSIDSTYKSNKKFITKSSAVAQLFFKPKPKDSVSIEGVKQAPQLRIALSSSFAAGLFAKLITPNFDNNSLQSELKGLKVIAESNNGPAAILYLNLLSAQSKINIYYKAADSDTSSITRRTSELVIGNDAIRVNYFEHNFNASIPSHTSSPSISDNMLYLKSMAGLKAVVKLPTLSNFTERYSISKAELVIPVDLSTVSGTYPVSPQLFLLGRDSIGGNYIIEDQFSGLGYYGGSYNSDNGTYTFNIAKHLQKIINKEIKDFGFNLITSGTAVTADRVVTYGGNTLGTNKISLKLTYIKLP